jgi:hypothetical protein
LVAFHFRLLRVALPVLLLAAVGCKSMRVGTQPLPVPKWEPVDVEHTSSVRALAKELGMAVRAEPAMRTLAIDGEYGRIVFLDGTRDVIVAGRRIQASETFVLDPEEDDLPLLGEDAATIRATWQQVTAESARDAQGGPGSRGGGRSARPTGTASGDPEWGVALKREWRGILIHHSATPDGNMARFDKNHREINGWLGIGYDFLICNGDGNPDGLVETTFRWKQQIQGAHAGVGLKEYNDHWVGICLVGNFDETKPTPKQLASLRRLVRYLQARCGIPDENVRFHRDVRDTDCPGRKFPAHEFEGSRPRPK